MIILLCDYSMFSQPGLNQVYTNPENAEGWFLTTSVFLEGETLVVYGHQATCPECTFHQRVTMARLSIDGEILTWENLLDNDQLFALCELKANKVSKDSDGNHLLVIRNWIWTDFPQFIDTLHVMRINPEGTVLLNTTIDVTNESAWGKFIPYHSLSQSQSEVIVCGYKADTTNMYQLSSFKGALFKYNIEDESIIRKEYENTWNVYRISEALDGGYWLSCGRFTQLGLNQWGISSPIDAVIIKTDSMGNELFREQMGGYGHDGDYHIIEEPNRLVVAGFETYEEPAYLLDPTAFYQGKVFVRTYEVLEDGLELQSETDVFS